MVIRRLRADIRLNTEPRPHTITRLFRPHYLSWPEQEQIEMKAPAYLRNAIRIIMETGLRFYKELACMKKSHVDLV